MLQSLLHYELLVLAMFEYSVQPTIITKLLHNNFYNTVIVFSDLLTDIPEFLNPVDTAHCNYSVTIFSVVKKYLLLTVHLVTFYMLHVV